MLRRAFAPFTALAMAGLIATAGPVGAATQTFTTTLTGEAEVPGPGDPNGSGTARVTVDSKTGRICYILLVSGIGKPIAAHIHFAPPDEPGPVVAPLQTPTNGRSSGCFTDRALARAILDKPRLYYVNVHTEAYPAGAIRGQLR